VNQAYQVLSNPMERAGYMLSMKGITVLHEDQADADTVDGMNDKVKSYYSNLMVCMGMCVVCVPFSSSSHHTKSTLNSQCISIYIHL